ncbi:hypothetical protein A6V25_30115 [Nostoc sp. ATCC 53789]|nr:hypothetical protein A6V25_30115 [Nostoc sp. ATCC 53789]
MGQGSNHPSASSKSIASGGAIALLYPYPKVLFSRDSFLIVILNSFRKILKDILKSLPKSNTNIGNEFLVYKEYAKKNYYDN